jgi:hypothetical protein
MDVMRSFGIPVPKGGMATNLDEVTQVVKLSVFQSFFLKFCSSFAALIERNVCAN